MNPLALYVVASVSYAASFAIAEPTSFYRDDNRLNMLETLEKYGYPSEVHYVSTDDGYILKMYRIPYGRECGPSDTKRDSVILMHGLLSSSIDYILAGVNNGLGFILADNCYDVWLPNARGNIESRNHTTIDPNSSKFWRFSWHEIGRYDLPALIKHILNATDNATLHYIGHSQGTTIFFVYASLYPEESTANVKSMQALAPVAFMENLYSPILRFVANYLGPLETLMDIIGWNEFSPEPEFIAKLGGDYCSKKHPYLEDLCENVMFILMGFDKGQFNISLLPLITSHDPAGASTRQLIHYGQEIKSGKFRQFDFGELENLAHYGSLEPPKYSIEAIKIPMYLHYSENDWMVSTIDVKKFASLTPTSTLFKVPIVKFNHLDFLFANDVKKVLYDEVLRLLKKSTNVRIK